MFVANAVVLIVAVGTIALSPARIPSPSSLGAIATLVGGVGAVLLVNLLLLRRTLRPLDRLADAMWRFDPLRTGARVPLYGRDPEVQRLTEAFNQMLARLESERRLSVRRSLLAQEDERARVARELHDEVGQTLTAVLLYLDRLGGELPESFAKTADEAREAARASLEDVRRIAYRLRPEMLDELGFLGAIDALCDRVSDRGGLRIVRDFDDDLPELDQEQELVVYRVTQEALTNVVRHAQAQTATVALVCDNSGLRLTVSDDGRGIKGPVEGAGTQGMRERALLVGGVLSLNGAPTGGTEVRLWLPVEDR